MKESTPEIDRSGDDVMKALGELKATTQEAAKDASSIDPNQDEVRSWITTIVKAIISAFKP